VCGLRSCTWLYPPRWSSCEPGRPLQTPAPRRATHIQCGSPVRHTATKRQIMPSFLQKCRRVLIPLHQATQPVGGHITHGWWDVTPSGESGPKDQVALQWLHYYYMVLRFRIGARQIELGPIVIVQYAHTISRHTDGISPYFVLASAGPLLPLVTPTIYILSCRTLPATGGPLHLVCPTDGRKLITFNRRQTFHTVFMCTVIFHNMVYTAYNKQKTMDPPLDCISSHPHTVWRPEK